MIDLKHGYHQMPLAEESRACTAMSTPLGPLQWKVMPMGVTNGNAAFQRMLENLLEPVRDCAGPFVDDVIIASGDPSMSYRGAPGGTREGRHSSAGPSGSAQAHGQQ